MAKIAYCRACKATYPLSVVRTEGGRSGKVKDSACPMGHAEEIDTPGRPRVKK